MNLPFKKQQNNKNNPPVTPNQGVTPQPGNIQTPYTQGGWTQDMGSLDDQTAQDPLIEFGKGINSIKDIIAPASIEVDFSHIKIGEKYYKTYFAIAYPRYVVPNWLSPLITFEHSIDISMFYYPISSNTVLVQLRRKIAEMEATTNTMIDSGKVLDPNLKVALEDAKQLQD
ncbi:MAG: hypothetical protein ACYDBX_02910, partial [Patescibacteria group bacterium]